MYCFVIMSRFLLQGVVFLCVSKKKNNSFLKKRVLFQGQNKFEWGDKPEDWRGICPSSYYVKNGPEYVQTGVNADPIGTASKK